VNRYEGVRFSDGSVALRRIDPDPCERATRTFESVHECNEELGRHETIRWLVDASLAIKASETSELTRREWAAPGFGFVEVPYTQPITRHRFKLDPVKRTQAPVGPQSQETAPRCGCPGCGKAASLERFHVVGAIRCDWCMSHCLIRTGEHTPQPSPYEPTEETDEP
jgi:hypothetical protein